MVGKIVGRGHVASEADDRDLVEVARLGFENAERVEGAKAGGGITGFDIQVAPKHSRILNLAVCQRQLAGYEYQALGGDSRGIGTGGLWWGWELETQFFQFILYRHLYPPVQRELVRQI